MHPLNWIIPYVRCNFFFDHCDVENAAMISSLSLVYLWRWVFYPSMLLLEDPWCCRCLVRSISQVRMCCNSRSASKFQLLCSSRQQTSNGCLRSSCCRLKSCRLQSQLLESALQDFLKLWLVGSCRLSAATYYYYYCNHMIFELLLECRLQSVVRIVTRQSRDLWLVSRDTRDFVWSR